VGDLVPLPAPGTACGGEVAGGGVAAVEPPDDDVEPEAPGAAWATYAAREPTAAAAPTAVQRDQRETRRRPRSRRLGDTGAIDDDGTEPAITQA
jgi:hypothetical protein